MVQSSIRSNAIPYMQLCKVYSLQNSASEALRSCTRECSWYVLDTGYADAGRLSLYNKRLRSARGGFYPPDSVARAGIEVVSACLRLAN